MRVQLSEEYLKKLQRIKDTIRDLENNSREPFVPYSPHGTSHCERLEGLLDRSLPDAEMENFNKAFTDQEKFLLLAAIWLHDIGMFPELFRDDPRKRGQDELTKWEQEVMRKTHHERSKRYVMENWKSLDLKQEEKEALALICKYHRKTQELPENTKEKICLVIAYLRLIDGLHIPDRPPRDRLSKLRTYLAYGMDPVAKFHWYKSFYISPTIGFNPDELKIEVKFLLPERWGKDGKKKMRSLIRAIKTDVMDELDAVKDILMKGHVKYGLPVYIHIGHDFELAALSDEEVDDLESLLTIIELFDPTIAPNSAELIGIVLSGIESCLNVGKIDFCVTLLESYQKDIIEPLLRHRPCHIFVKKLQKKLTDLFDQHQPLRPRSDKEQFLNDVRILVDALKDYRRDLKRELSEKALDTLGITNDDVILLYGYSSSVEALFDRLSQNLKDTIEIIVCECSTKTKHRYNNRLIYSDGIHYLKKLDEKGVRKIFLSPDLCTSHLFVHGKVGSEGTRRVTKVLFGANGIDNQTGNVAHGLGHLAISDIAQKYDVPVYVIAESMKIGELKPSQHLQRKEPWYPTDVSFDDIDKLKSYNPREDIVPSKLVYRVITEKGAIQPNDVSTVSSTIDEIINYYKSKQGLS